MRLLVAVKRVIDYSVKVRLNAAKTAVETAGVKMSLNPFCEIATEEAVVLRQSGVASDSVAVSIGPKAAAESLRTALAMGIDRAIHIETDDTNLSTDLQLQPLTVAKIMAWMAHKEKIDMILMGKQAIDDDSNQTAQLTAALLNWPQATFASKITPAQDKKSVTVAREVDGGSQVLSVPVPCVISADLRLNTPRYATLPNIMKAKKKPIQTVSLSALAKEIASAGKIGNTTTTFDLKPRLKLVGMADPDTRKAGVKVESVEQLFHKLVNEAKVIA